MSELQPTNGLERRTLAQTNDQQVAVSQTVAFGSAQFDCAALDMDCSRNGIPPEDYIRNVCHVQCSYRLLFQEWAQKECLAHRAESGAEMDSKEIKKYVEIEGRSLKDADMDVMTPDGWTRAAWLIGHYRS